MSQSRVHRKDTKWVSDITFVPTGEGWMYCVPNKGFATRQQAWQEMFEYIEVFYNRQRLHAALGYLTPANALLVYLNHFSTK